MFADDLGTGVAGEHTEAVVYLQDAGFRVGDDDAFVGMAEHAGGEAQVVFGRDPGGDVVEGAGGADQLVVGVDDGAHEKVQPACAAVAALHAQGDAAVVARAFDEGLEGFAPGFPVVRVEIVEEALADGFVHRNAGDLGPGGVEQLPAAAGVGL